MNFEYLYLKAQLDHERVIADAKAVLNVPPKPGENPAYDNKSNDNSVIYAMHNRVRSDY